jgi:hypothetical protein
MVVSRPRAAKAGLIDLPRFAGAPGSGKLLQGSSCHRNYEKLSKQQGTSPEPEKKKRCNGSVPGPSCPLELDQGLIDEVVEKYDVDLSTLTIGDALSLPVAQTRKSHLAMKARGVELVDTATMEIWMETGERPAPTALGDGGPARPARPSGVRACRRPRDGADDVPGASREGVRSQAHLARGAPRR